MRNSLSQLRWQLPGEGSLKLVPQQKSLCKQKFVAISRDFTISMRQLICASLRRRGSPKRYLWALGVRDWEVAKSSILTEGVPLI